MDTELIENEDYYFDGNRYMVLTAKYLLQKGECCGNGCRHCPYNYINVPNPLKSELVKASNTASLNEKE